jgi:hypothetical protein
LIGQLDKMAPVAGKLGPALPPKKWTGLSCF